MWSGATNLSIITGEIINTTRIYTLIDIDPNIPEEAEVIAYVTSGDDTVRTAEGRVFARTMRSLVNVFGGEVNVEKVFTAQNTYSKDRYMDLIVRPSGP